jgi:hypothetical protein
LFKEIDSDSKHEWVKHQYFSYIVLLMEENGVPGENHQPVESQWRTLSQNVVSSTPRHNWGQNSQL